MSTREAIDALEKAMQLGLFGGSSGGHKYIKRTGTAGAYKYEYAMAPNAHAAGQAQVASTSAGKPIRGDASHPAHAAFNGQEHAEAAAFHTGAAAFAAGTGMAAPHAQQAQVHGAAAQKSAAAPKERASHKVTRDPRGGWQVMARVGNSGAHEELSRHTNKGAAEHARDLAMGAAKNRATHDGTLAGAIKANVERSKSKAASRSSHIHDAQEAREASHDEKDVDGEVDPGLKKYREHRDAAMAAGQKAGSPTAEDGSAEEHSTVAFLHRKAAASASAIGKDKEAESEERAADMHSKAAKHAAHLANARKATEAAHEADGPVADRLSGAVTGNDANFDLRGSSALMAAADDASHKHSLAADARKVAGYNSGGHRDRVAEHGHVADYAHKAGVAHGSTEFATHNPSSRMAAITASEQHTEAAAAARKLGARGERLAKMHDEAAAAHGPAGAEPAPRPSKKKTAKGAASHDEAASSAAEKMPTREGTSLHAPLHAAQEAVDKIDPDKLKTKAHFADAHAKFKELASRLHDKLGAHPAHAHASKAAGLADMASASMGGGGIGNAAATRHAREILSDAKSHASKATEAMPAHLKKSEAQEEPAMPAPRNRLASIEATLLKSQDRSAGPPPRQGLYDGLASGMVDATADRPRWPGKSPSQQGNMIAVGQVDGGNTSAYQKARQVEGPIELAKSAVVAAVKDGYRAQLMAAEDNHTARLVARSNLPGARPTVPHELRKSMASGEPDPDAVVAFAAAALWNASASNAQLREGLSRLAVSRRTLRDTLDALGLTPASVSAGY